MLRDHPELIARMTRMDAAPEANGHGAAQKVSSDPSVKPASAGERREADSSAALSLPTRAPTNNRGRCIRSIDFAAAQPSHSASTTTLCGNHHISIVIKIP
jgi:hypothetical protein